MSGAGHMLHAIKSLKLNRDLLKSHRHKNKKGSSGKSTGTTKVVFKTVSPKELNKIKEDIRNQAKKSKQQELIVLIFVLVGFGLFLIWLFS